MSYMPAVSLRDAISLFSQPAESIDPATRSSLDVDDGFTPTDKILVFDSFSPFPPHGEWLRYLATTSGLYTDDREVVKVVVPSFFNNEAEFIDNFDGQLKAALQSDTGARVINISSGRSPARAVSEMADALLKWPDSLDAARAELAQPGEPVNEQRARDALTQADQLISDFGLAPDARKEDILRAVVQRAVASFSGEVMDAARARIGQTISALHDKGISVVISAGNQQAVADQLSAMGIGFNADTFLDNSLVQGPAISVGATTRSVQDFSPDIEASTATPAAFSSASGEVAIAADGTDITLPPQSWPNTTQTRSGTSFAAPQVAALLADLYALNPALSPDEALAILQDTAVAPTGQDALQLGAGLIVPQAARHAALYDCGG